MLAKKNNKKLLTHPNAQKVTKLKPLVKPKKVLKNQMPLSATLGIHKKGLKCVFCPLCAFSQSLCPELSSSPLVWPTLSALLITISAEQEPKTVEKTQAQKYN